MSGSGYFTRQDNAFPSTPRNKNNNSNINNNNNNLKEESQTT